MSNSLAIKTGTGFRRAFGRGSAPRALPRQARSSTSSLSPDRQARARAPSWASSSSAASPSTSPAISHKGERVAAHERQWTLLQWPLPRSSRQARLQGARRPLRHHSRLQQRLRALRQRPCHASRDRSQGRADSADCAAAARGSCSSSFCGVPATANMRSGGTNCAWRSIGSLSGSHWLVRRAATDLHCFAVGIEASDCIDAGELSPALRSSGAHGDHQVIRGPEGPSCLAEIRCRICMSVVHHIIRAYGLATARIRNRARVSREQRADLRGRYGRRKLVDRILA